MTLEAEEEAAAGGSPTAKPPEATSSRKYQNFTKQLAELNARESTDTAKEKADDKAFLHEMAKVLIKSPKHTVDSFKTDRDLLLRAVKEHKDGWRLLKLAQPELRADRELLLAAVKGTSAGWKAMLNAPAELREDRDLCIEAVRRNAAALEMLSPKLRKDMQLVSEALGAINRRLQAPTQRAAAAEWNRALHHTRSEAEQLLPRQQGVSVLDHVVKERGEGRAERLKTEITRGLGMVHQGEDDAPLRTVSLMNLWISNPNGLVLVLLGRFDTGELTGKCMLPGRKIREGHQPRDEVTVYLNTVFFRFKQHLKVDLDFDMHTEESRSATFGLQTLYRKATFKTVAKSGLPWRQATTKISRFKSPHAVMPSHSIARRFGRGQAIGTGPPKPPDMYTLNSVEGRWQFNPDKLDIFAWIPVWEYEWLKGSELGRATLEDWLMDVDVPGHLAAMASASASASRSPSPSRSQSRNLNPPWKGPNSPRPQSGMSGFGASPRRASSHGSCRPPPLSHLSSPRSSVCSPCGGGSSGGHAHDLPGLPPALDRGSPTPRAGGRPPRSPSQAPPLLPDAQMERGGLRGESRGARGQRGYF